VRAVQHIFKQATPHDTIMLLAVYVTLQVILLVAFIGSFSTKNAFLWAITALLAGFVAMSAWGIQTTNDYPQNTTVATVSASVYDPVNNLTTSSVNQTTKNATPAIYTYSDPALFWFNAGIFFISVIYFIVCVLEQKRF